MQISARPKILAGNWKMNYGPTEAIEYFSTLTKLLASIPSNPGVRRVVFPGAYALGTDVQSAAKTAGVELGAQNVHWAESGAFTGELAGPVLKKMGVHWVLIAHSERRQYFGETDETAMKRFERAALLGLNVVFCIGERLEEREKNQTEEILTRQIQSFIQVASKHQPQANAVWSIAYEPVWAIGTGKTATTEQAEQAHRHIRKVVWDQLGLEIAQRLPILYGGSVTAENAATLLLQPNVDGVLVGGASLKPDQFGKILQAV